MVAGSSLIISQGSGVPVFSPKDQDTSKASTRPQKSNTFIGDSFAKLNQLAQGLSTPIKNVSQSFFATKEDPIPPSFTLSPWYQNFSTGLEISPEQTLALSDIETLESALHQNGSWRIHALWGRYLKLKHAKAARLTDPSHQDQEALLKECLVTLKHLGAALEKFSPQEIPNFDKLAIFSLVFAEASSTFLALQTYHPSHQSDSFQFAHDIWQDLGKQYQGLAKASDNSWLVQRAQSDTVKAWDTFKLAAMPTPAFIREAKENLATFLAKQSDASPKDWPQTWHDALTLAQASLALGKQEEALGHLIGLKQRLTTLPQNLQNTFKPLLLQSYYDLGFLEEGAELASHYQMELAINPPSTELILTGFQLAQVSWHYGRSLEAQNSYQASWEAFTSLVKSGQLSEEIKTQLLGQALALAQKLGLESELEKLRTHLKEELSSNIQPASRLALSLALARYSSDVDHAIAWMENATEELQHFSKEEQGLLYASIEAFYVDAYSRALVDNPYLAKKVLRSWKRTLDKAQLNTLQQLQSMAAFHQAIAELEAKHPWLEIREDLAWTSLEKIFCETLETIEEPQQKENAALIATTILLQQKQFLAANRILLVYLEGTRLSHDLPIAQQNQKLEMLIVLTLQIQTLNEDPKFSEAEKSFLRADTKRRLADLWSRWGKNHLPSQLENPENAIASLKAEFARIQMIYYNGHPDKAAEDFRK